MIRTNLAVLLAAGLFILPVALMAQTIKPAPAATGAPTHVGGAKPVTATHNKSTLVGSMARGKQVYQLQCLACHQVDAGGVQGMTPPLTQTKWVLGDKTALVQIVLTGMKGVEIDGDAYHNVMAPHSELTDQQIADVLTFVRNSFGNKAKAVTPAEVKAIRVKTKLN
jgi:mono/diheme cytochrome c family protein